MKLFDKNQILILTCSFIILQCVECSRNRQFYGGRVLNIAPKECISPHYPDLRGTCMISLECQQRSGTVIGACRDGLLFGACCHKADDVSTLAPEPDNLSSFSNIIGSTMGHSATFTTQEESTTTLNSVSSTRTQLLSDKHNHSTVNESFQPLFSVLASRLRTPISASTVISPISHPSTTTTYATTETTTSSTTHPSTTTPVTTQTFPSSTHPSTTTLATTQTLSSSTHPSSTTTQRTIETTSKLSPVPTLTTILPISSTFPVEPSKLPETTTQKPIEYSSEAVSAIFTSPSTLAIISTTKTPPNYTTTPSTPTPTTKFSYGKIKYSPRPMKKRPTTRKTVWTRPPTTETSYSVFPNSDESDEDDDNGVEAYSKHVVTQKLTTPRGSVESSTISQNRTSIETSTAVQSSSSVESSTIILKNIASVETSTIIVPSSSSVESAKNLSSIESDTMTTVTTVSQNISASAEISTTNNIIPKSTEEITTVSITPSIVENIENIEDDDTPKPIVGPFTTEKQIMVDYFIPNITILNTNVSTPNVSVPMKQSRLSNDISNNGDSSSDDSSNSAGWENKLDDFVNQVKITQVVEGIAEELDKSNIDAMVFKATSTTPKTTTAIVTKRTKTTTTKKPKRKTVMTKAPSPKPKNDSIKYQKIPPSKLKKPKPQSEVKKQRKPKPTKPPVIASDEIDDDLENDILDYRTSCGVQPLVRQSRIVGGNPSTYGTWPWHALVKETVWWGIFSKIKCGGVLIGARHVLTASHCQPQKTGTLSVVLGLTDSDNPNANAVTKGVRRVIPHPQFNPRSYENDIAILELDSPVDFQPNIVPICLPNLKENFVGKKGFVTGMGLLKHDGERPSHLHEVDVPILNNTECQSMFRRSGNMKPIKPSFICAGYPQGLKDSCGGDSGGPLSVKRSNGQWVLAGTVSHGIKCAVPNQPGVYMRTTWYLPWVQKVMRMARTVEGPICHGPPSACAINNHQARSGGLMETIFRIFRIARKFWKSRK